METHAQPVTSKIIEEMRIRKNLQNLFSSIAVKDADRGEIYRDIVKQEITKERKAFSTMKEGLRIVPNAREKMSNQKINIHENFTPIKRETVENNRKLDYYIDLFFELNGAERFDVLKYLDPHIGAELRQIPVNPSTDDPAALKRLREHISYHTAMTSVKEGIKYVYVRDVLAHAYRCPVKLNKTAATTKLTLDKRMWTDFLQDPLANGTGPITRKLLLEKGTSADEFTDRMVWVYDFIYDWLDFFYRVPRNESINPAKHGWPFTKTHLDFVNIFRKSLNQDALEMTWLDEGNDLVLPQIVIVDPLVAGTKESWERLGFF